MNQHQALAPQPSQPQHTKGELFRLLNQNIPLNSFHLPDHIYRADLVPLDLYSYDGPDRNNILEGATLNVTFDHGYPAVQETLPMWERLPGEPDNAYESYLLFLELPEKSNADNPVRLVPLIAQATGHSVNRIGEWCHIYYWHWRARAYDLFLAACHRKQREQRIMSIEGQHFALAEGLLRQAQSLAGKKLQQELSLLEENEEAETETKVKDLIDAITKLTALQRISVGLPAGGPERLQVEMPRHSTVSESFRQIAKEGRGEESTTTRSVEMDALLANPDELSRAQELLIKLNNPQHQLPDWSKDYSTTIDAENSSEEEDGNKE